MVRAGGRKGERKHARSGARSMHTLKMKAGVIINAEFDGHALVAEGRMH